MASWWGIKDRDHFHWYVDYEYNNKLYNLEYGSLIPDYDKKFKENSLGDEIKKDICKWIEYYDENGELKKEGKGSLSPFLKQRDINVSEVNIVKITKYECDCFNY